MSNPSSLNRVLAEPYPILFVLIGWTHRYDGTEPVRGNHAFLHKNPRDNSEACAFLPGKDRIVAAGVGRGAIDAGRVHVVLVARDWDIPGRPRKLVGVYAGATIELDGDWAWASTKDFRLVPVDDRPTLSDRDWPGYSGMRRWARTSAEANPGLLRYFEWMRKYVTRRTAKAGMDNSGPVDQVYSDFVGRDGELRSHSVRHRVREARLREAKIQNTLKTEHDLRCEVPGCGFSFVERYGQLGVGYAQVHHLKPLSSAPKLGRATTLDDLAVVCANCHAMIHRFGASRNLSSVLPKRKSGRQ